MYCKEKNKEVNVSTRKDKRPYIEEADTVTRNHDITIVTVHILPNILHITKRVSLVKTKRTKQRYGIVHSIEMEIKTFN